MLDDAQFSKLLDSAQRGDLEAEKQLFELIQPEIRSMAEGIIRQKGAHIRATSLANDAYIRIMRKASTIPSSEKQNRAYFFTSFAKCMRNLLVDRMRRRNVEHQAMERLADNGFDHFIEEFEKSTRWSYERVHRIVDRFLASEDPKQRRRHELINLHYFCGMTYKDAAEELGISATQYQKDRDRAIAELQSAYLNDD